MKRKIALLTLAAGLVFGPAAAVAAQELPDQPGMGAAQSTIDDQGATAGAPRLPRAADVPGRGALPDVSSRAPAANLSGTPRRLPATGQNLALMGLVGLGLVGLGSGLVAISRRRAPDA